MEETAMPDDEDTLAEILDQAYDEGYQAAYAEEDGGYGDAEGYGAHEGYYIGDNQTEDWWDAESKTQ